MLCIFLLACLFRVCTVLFLLGLDWWYNSGEGYEHTLLSEYMLSNSCYMPPGQFLFAGLINQPFGQPSYSALRIATVLLSALVSVNIYRIGREHFGMTTGIVAGYLSCISLSFAFHAWTFYPTILSAALFSCFVVHFLRMLDAPKRYDALLAGLFLGLSILSRSEMIIFLPLSVIWLLLVRGIHGEPVRRCCALLTVCGIIIMGWSLRNYKACDKFVLVSSNAPVNYFIGNNPMQKGGYFPPLASKDQREDYLQAGIIYDLTHPGWFVQFFAEKFKLCWSGKTWEHPLQLLESKFENSTVKLFNNTFSHSRLGAILSHAEYDSIYRRITSSYGLMITAFWYLVLVGVFSCHLRWKHGYFIIILCLSMTVLLSFFISGAQRWSIPLLPYFYILMGMGIVFICKIFTVTWSELKVLLAGNTFFLMLLLMMYISGQALIHDSANQRVDTIEELYPWNVFSTEDESVRLIILESQLAYPVKGGALHRDHFSIRIGNYEIPHLEIAKTGSNHEKYYFKRVQDLLCKNAIIINIPTGLMYTLLNDGDSRHTVLHGGSIIEALRGRITVGYTPAWQFPIFVENMCTYLLEQIVTQNMNDNAQRV